ncbi:uncharacterized protein MELLADRAFT_102474 [Melampsora larici-populina 98AG31]|uniref:Uncharacterized protein n=1 Tax=Melampsora larici-populina (strain 98AG31 / pathotype 3-4-7) TaxID=747676 RepID=F4R8F8_MELLP|nr:uncharacterized protein MELLADRAFT_102474 [Melampsora larici-populina 98AG31]EGG11478.1 hypothetical protein MELLADRAFT_102474 [Melampsora larici-populina 98AG31]
MSSTLTMLKKMTEILNFPPGINPYRYAAKLLESSTIAGRVYLYACLCSPLGQIPRPLRPLVTRPQVVNLIGILFPVAVSVGTIAWVFFLIFAYHHESLTFTQLSASIMVAGDEFEAGKTVDLKDLIKVGLKFHNVNSELMSRIRWNSFFWAIIGFITLLLFVLSGWSLIALLRHGATKLEALKPNNAHLKLSDVTQFLSSHPKQIARDLKRGYAYVVCHFVIMMASMSYKIVICVIIGVHADLMVMDARWRSLGSWLYLLCGVIVAPAMLLQTWRIFTDLDIIIPESQVGETHPAETNCDTNIETDNYSLEDFSLCDVKATCEVPEVQIVQARVATRPARAQVIVIRRAF